MPRLVIEGAELAYELHGSGEPALVLVHGGMCTRRDWRHQVAALAGEFAVLTFDLRCHGQSTGTAASFTIETLAADLNRLVEAIGLAPVVLVGHSLASRVVAEAAWQRPDNALGVVLLDGSRSDGGLAASVPPPDQQVEPRRQSLDEILAATVGPFAADELRLDIITTMSAAPPAVMSAAVEAMREWDLDRADRVFSELPAALPMLAIQSTYHDRFTPRRSLTAADETTPYLTFLKGVRPKLDVRVLPHTGHFSMLERPGEVSALIAAFARATANMP